MTVSNLTATILPVSFRYEYMRVSGRVSVEKNEKQPLRCYVLTALMERSQLNIKMTITNYTV